MQQQKKAVVKKLFNTSMPLGNVDKLSDDLPDEGIFYTKIIIAYVITTNSTGIIN